MLSEMVRITSVVLHGVSLEDIHVYLPGKGNYQDVDSNTASTSKDLQRYKNWVRIDKIDRKKPVPIWPFVKAQPPASVYPVPAPIPVPAQVPDQSSPELIRVLKKLESSLVELLQRPSSPSPEVVAAHVRSLQEMQFVPAGLPGGPRLPGPGASSDPIFIPSTIVPVGAETDIKVREEKVEKSDLEDGIAALRRARGQ